MLRCFVALIKCAAVLIFFLSITLFALLCTCICTLVKTNTYNTDCYCEATPETVSLWLQILNESSDRLMDLHPPFQPLPSFLLRHLEGIDSTQISLKKYWSLQLCTVHINIVDFDSVHCWHTTCFCSSVKIHDLAEMKEIYAIITLEDAGGTVFY